MEREVTEFFADKDGVDILLDVLSHPKPHAELAALALQYFLHIAADHAECLSEELKARFEAQVLPQLVANELTKELLVETLHRCGLHQGLSLGPATPVGCSRPLLSSLLGSRPAVLSYESVPEVRECDPPLISRIAVRWRRT